MASLHQPPNTHGISILLTVSLLVGALSGCVQVGPRSIRAGRLVYAEAINQTEDDQILLSIVKGRYGELTTLLAVSGIAANIRFRTDLGTEIGFGPQTNYDGNLVPFAGGFAYEENPTITYSPVQGDQYLRQLMSPVPLEFLLLALRSATPRDRIFTLLVNRANDMKNPDFLSPNTTETDKNFSRFVQLFTKLRMVGVMELAANPQSMVAFNVWIDKYAPTYTDDVVEMLDLLNIPVPEDHTKTIIIPAYFAINSERSYGIGFTTRSTYDLIEILRASVQVPEEHSAPGLTLVYPPTGLPGQGLKIHSSKTKPDNASRAVKYRDYWFYIEDNDRDTKSVFNAVRTLWSVTIAGSSDQSTAPVLTLPIG